MKLIALSVKPMQNDQIPFSPFFFLLWFTVSIVTLSVMTAPDDKKHVAFRNLGILLSCLFDRLILLVNALNAINLP